MLCMIQITERTFKKMHWTWQIKVPLTVYFSSEASSAVVDGLRQWVSGRSSHVDLIMREKISRWRVKNTNQRSVNAFIAKQQLSFPRTAPAQNPHTESSVHVYVTSRENLRITIQTELRSALCGWCKRSSVEPSSFKLSLDFKCSCCDMNPERLPQPSNQV